MFVTLPQMQVCVVVQSVIPVVMTTSCVAMLVQRAQPFSVLMDGLKTRLLLRPCVLARRVIIRALITTCVAMLEQRARPFSVLMDWLTTRVLLRHYVLAGRAIIRALITTCVAMRNRSRHSALHWSAHQPLMLLTPRHPPCCVKELSATLAPRT